LLKQHILIKYDELMAIETKFDQANKLILKRLKESKMNEGNNKTQRGG
jgi:hypothetical protein